MLSFSLLSAMDKASASESGGLRFHSGTRHIKVKMVPVATFLGAQHHTASNV